MIELDELYDIFCNAHRKKFDEMIAEHGAFNEDECIRVGIAAVVRALKPKLADWFYAVHTEVTLSQAENLATNFIKSILDGQVSRCLCGHEKGHHVYGAEKCQWVFTHPDNKVPFDCRCRKYEPRTMGDGAGTREGWPLVEGADKAKAATSPASFCEWALLETAPLMNKYKKACNGESTIAFDTARECHICKKPIKFMADASTRKDEGLSGSSVRQPAPTQATASAATIITKTLSALFGRSKEISGLGSNAANAQEFIKDLHAAGYKILPREPTEEMISTIGSTSSSRMVATEDWRKMWDAAK